MRECKEVNTLHITWFYLSKMIYFRKTGGLGRTQKYGFQIERKAIKGMKVYMKLLAW